MTPQSLQLLINAAFAAVGIIISALAGWVVLLITIKQGQTKKELDKRNAMKDFDAMATISDKIVKAIDQDPKLKILSNEQKAALALEWSQHVATKTGIDPKLSQMTLSSSIAGTYHLTTVINEAQVLELEHTPDKDDKPPVTVGGMIGNTPPIQGEG